MSFLEVLLQRVNFTAIFILACASGTMGNVLISGSQGGLPLTRSFMTGARGAIEECQRQFASDVWQCPMDDFINMLEDETPTKKAAFVTAITSASIVHTITKNCTNGNLLGCSCTQYGKVESAAAFKWGLCSDDVTYGIDMTKYFFESRIEGNDARAQIVKHNHRAGRIAVKNTRKKICMCHGTSGSCAMETCWMQLEDFSTVASKLKQEYQKAIKLRDGNNDFNIDTDQNSIPTRGLNRRPKVSENRMAEHSAGTDWSYHPRFVVPEKGSFNIPDVSSSQNYQRRSSKGSRDSRSAKESDAMTEEELLEVEELDIVTPEHLVYLKADDPPAFCKINKTSGLPGTLGHQCLEVDFGTEVDATMMDPCYTLCGYCGYSVVSRVDTFTFSCECHSEFDCEICAKKVVRYTCALEKDVPNSIDV